MYVCARTHKKCLKCQLSNRPWPPNGVWFSFSGVCVCVCVCVPNKNHNTVCTNHSVLSCAFIQELDNFSFFQKIFRINKNDRKHLNRFSSRKRSRFAMKIPSNDWKNLFHYSKLILFQRYKRWCFGHRHTLTLTEWSFRCKFVAAKIFSI